VKQLFRRVAAALPGMEVKEDKENLVEVNLQVLLYYIPQFSTTLFRSTKARTTQQQR
jgi:hypothetical protein